MLINSSYITIRGCNIQGAGVAVKSVGKRGHHILIENNEWKSMVSDDLFKGLNYCHVKWCKDYTGPLFYHFMAQGSLFFNSEGGGGSVIRNNHTINTFNALKGGCGGAMNCGDNVEIYDNIFERSTDNVYEVEGKVFNQHFYHNILIGYKTSNNVVVRAEGGPLYFYGNITYGGGKAWKLPVRYMGPFLNDTLHCYHNVFHTVGGFKKGHSVKNMHHYNNIYLTTPEFIRGLGMEDWTFDFSGYKNIFDYDCLFSPVKSDLSWPKIIRKYEQEQNGLINQDPMFVSSGTHDYRLKRSHPLKKSQTAFYIRSLIEAKKLTDSLKAMKAALQILALTKEIG